MNRLKQRIASKGCVIGTLVSIPSPALAETLSWSGLDWLFFDMEHSTLDIADIQTMIQAMNPDCLSFIRIEEASPVYIKRALDTGCDGLIIPQVNDPQTATLCINAAFYPPQGGRSVGLGRSSRYGINLADAISHDNERMSIFFQIEHRDAVSHLDEIAATPGLSGLFVGPYDLSGSYGKPGQINDAEVAKAIDLTIKKARDTNLAAGIFVGNDAAIPDMKDRGFQFICAGSDLMRLSASAQASTKT